jgi:N6-L-threonylcarbamoyladenine synthase
MLILGIETSCDETAAAVVEDGVLVRSSFVAGQHDLHADYGGVVPEIASRAHVEAILPTLRGALRDAGLSPRDLSAVAVGHRPGLIGSLLVGVAAAKAVAWALGVPLIGVDHVHAHLYAGQLHDAADDGPAPPPAAFPALGLVVSGGHTSLYAVRSWADLARLGATIDDALGEAYDKAAVILGLPHPGGPNLDALARREGANDRAVDFPVSRLAPDSLDFSFSGLKTAMLYAVRGVPASPRAHTPPPPPPPPLTEQRRADLAASFQRAASGAALLKLTRALEAMEQRGEGPRTLLCGGGVTANSRLRRELESFAARRHLRLALPRMAYCVDNAAMIAGLAHHHLARGATADLSLQPVPTTAC